MVSGKNFIDLLHTNINQYKVLITNKDLISTQVNHSLQGAESFFSLPLNTVQVSIIPSLQILPKNDLPLQITITNYVTAPQIFLKTT